MLNNEVPYFMTNKAWYKDNPKSVAEWNKFYNGDVEAKPEGIIPYVLTELATAEAKTSYEKYSKEWESAKEDNFDFLYRF